MRVVHAGRRASPAFVVTGEETSRERGERGERGEGREGRVERGLVQHAAPASSG
jgi:hypothetical protein